MSSRLKLVVPPALATLSIGAVLLVPGLLDLPTSVAQSSDIAWVRQFGTAADEGATSLAVTPQDEVFVVGWTTGVLPGEVSASSGRAAFARKYSADGTQVWSHQFGAGGAINVMSADADNADNLAVAGQVRGGALPGQARAGLADAFVRKYGPGGTEQWTRQFGGSGADETAVGQVRASQGGAVMVSGWTDSALPGKTPLAQPSTYQIFVRNLDAAGAETWATQFATPGHARPTALAIDIAGRSIVTGVSARDASAIGRRDKSEPFVWAIDKLGKAAPKVKLPELDTGNVSAFSVAANGVPAIAMAGQETEEHGHAYVRKVDVLGHDAWQRAIRIAGNDFVTAVAIDAAGAVYVGGYMGVDPAPSSDISHVWVQKYAADGVLAWTRTLGTTNKDILSALAVTPRGTVYLAGWTRGTFAGQSNSGRSDAFVAKLK